MWKMHDSPAEGRDHGTVAKATTLGLVALMGTLTFAGCGNSDGPTGDDTPDPPETPALADPPPDGAAAAARWPC